MFFCCGHISFSHPLSLEQVQCSVIPPAVSVLSRFTVCQFCRAFWVWVLLTGSAREFCDPLPALLQGVAYCPSVLSLPAFSMFVYWFFYAEITSLHSPFLWCTFSIPTPSAVLLHYSLLFVVHFFLMGVSVFPGSVLVYPGGGSGNSTWCLLLICLVCWMSHRQF
jgi:hypothetical protein